MTQELRITGRAEGGDHVVRQFLAAGAKARRLGAAKVRETSFGLERRIKSDMPVDEGRARAGWGHWTPESLINATADSSQDDAHWIESNGGLVIEQGTNVPYTSKLNEGHSKQAPAGFIDKAVEVAQRALINAVARILDEVF